MKYLLITLLTLTNCYASVPKNCTQAIVGITSGWDSSQVTLAIYEKKNGAWQPQTKPWHGRLGKNGMAWGKGLHSTVQSNAPTKVEGDKRAPAGIFKIGGAYGYAANIQRNPDLPYRQVTKRDLWVEDQTSPHYNRHLLLDHDPSLAWEKKAQMRQGDYAHALKLYIAHNDAILGGKATPGQGSAIFFHIWRGGGSKATYGCTTMQEANLKTLIAAIDPRKNPVYILLPSQEYQSYRASWKLP